MAPGTPGAGQQHRAVSPAGRPRWRRTLRDARQSRQLGGDGRLEGGQVEPDRPRERTAVPEPAAPDPDERALGQPTRPEHLSESQHLVDGQLVRGARCGRIGLRQDLADRQDHHVARRNPHGRIHDHGDLARAHVREVLDTEMPAATDLETLQQR